MQELNSCIIFVSSMQRSNDIKTKNMNEAKLRLEAKEMTKSQMIYLRDELESNWDESKRNMMIILSMACINKFKTTLSSL